MKKTTLISTLAMVVIVALALTTATFAWYTSNNQVTATSSATAATAGSADLLISKGDEDYQTTVSYTLANSLNPAAVNIASADALVYKAAASDSKPATASLSFVGKVVTGSAANRAFGSDVTTNLSAENSINVKNASPEKTKAVEIKMHIALSNDTSGADGNLGRLGNGLRIAVFQKNTSESAFSLVAIIGNKNSNKGFAWTNNWAGNPTPGSLETIDPTVSFGTVAGNQVSLGRLAGGGVTELKLVTWIDGEVVTEADATKTVNMSITFSGGDPEPVGP